MFWGLIMEPGRCYTQTVKISFHVSMAALDISNSSEGPVQVMCVIEGRNYLLCTLDKENIVQCALDLNFETGTKVSFATNGNSHVHLTGYLTTLEDELFEEEEEDQEDEPVLNNEKKRNKKQLSPPTKKAKLFNSSSSLNNDEDEEEESSDSDFDLSKVLNDSGGEEEEDSEVNEEDGEEEESEDEELEEEETEAEDQVKPKQNGIGKSNTASNETNKKEKAKKVRKEKNNALEEKKLQNDSKGKKAVLKGGVMIQDLKEGAGDTIKSGKFAHVYYEGRLKENNKVFDATTKGPGFSFRLGKGEVIRGWDIGVVGMKVGGKRRIICPPNVAYGVKGSPPVIPPNSTLVFDVELKKIS